MDVEGRGQTFAKRPIDVQPLCRSGAWQDRPRGETPAPRAPGTLFCYKGPRRACYASSPPSAGPCPLQEPRGQADPRRRAGQSGGQKRGVNLIDRDGRTYPLFASRNGCLGSRGGGVRKLVGNGWSPQGQATKAAVCSGHCLTQMPMAIRVRSLV